MASADAKELDFDSLGDTRALVAPLLARSNHQGATRLMLHLLVLGATGSVLALNVGTVWQIPLTVLHGIVIGTLFAVVHEGVHYTSFADKRWCNVSAWVAGLVIGLNSTFYRQFHYEHHRHTQVPGRDPELGAPPPTSWGNYLLRLSAIPYWQTRLSHMISICTNDFGRFPYIPKGLHSRIRRSMLLSAIIYVAILLASIGLDWPWAIWLWFLPLIVGQPVVRFWLMCEHSGCTFDRNGFSNTRTTKTVWPVRFLMWNMPYHAEHHLHPQIPFHALPRAHAMIGSRIVHAGRGYVGTNLALVTTMHSTRAEVERAWRDAYEGDSRVT
ncbi:MAG: fatty acid desaturase [Pseudomonadota bacterium]